MFNPARNLAVIAAGYSTLWLVIAAMAIIDPDVGVPMLIEYSKAGLFIALSGIVLFMLILSVLMFRNRDIFRRNEDATKLARKCISGIKMGPFTSEERIRFNSYVKSRVLTYNSDGVLRVSDEAVREAVSW